MELREFIEKVRLMRQEQQNYHIKMMVYTSTRKDADYDQAQAHIAAAKRLEKEVDQLLHIMQMNEQNIGTL